MSSEKQILFVCTGNFYRSRLAELLFNHYAQEAGLDWTADSRGLLDRPGPRGLSPSASKYLKERDLDHLTVDPRSGRPIKLDHLERFELIVGMCRKEHASLMLTRFGQIPRMMEKEGTLRYWNVDDLPTPSHLAGGLMQKLKMAMSTDENHIGQKEESGCEHIDFAVQALIVELGKEVG
ncbi:low molecular weight phosphatase family protein [bacterium]|nr:low molecular weight phosphatase family protein [bacterium]